MRIIIYEKDTSKKVERDLRSLSAMKIAPSKIQFSRRDGGDGCVYLFGFCLAFPAQRAMEERRSFCGERYKEQQRIFFLFYEEQLEARDERTPRRAGLEEAQHSFTNDS
jgi:hypothetical protein